MTKRSRSQMVIKDPKSTCGIIGFHATTKENMKKIMKEGIKPGMKG